MSLDSLPSPADTAAGLTWKRLLAVATVLAAAGDLAVQALAGEVIPPLAASILITAVGLALLRRPGRAGTVVLLLGAVAFLIGAVQFSGPSLAHPESPVDYVHALLGLPTRVVAIVAAAASLRGRAGAPAWRPRLQAGMLAAAVLPALVVPLTVSSDAAVGADTAVVAEDLAWEPGSVTVDGGAVFVDNRDLFRHTFAVAGTDVDVELPARAQRRIELGLAPGTYELRCNIPGHETMTATLVVE